MSRQPAPSPADEIWGLIKKSQQQAAAREKEAAAREKEFAGWKKELAARQKEFAGRQKEIQQMIIDLTARQAETDRQIEKTARQIEKTDRQMEKTDRQIQKIGGRFNQRWGALVESLVEGKLVKIFQDRKIDITQTHTRSKSEWRKSKNHVERREFDIIVANGTEVVVVEVKTVLTPQDVNCFLETLRDFKNYFPRYKKETVYGATAYLSCENKSDSLAEKEGLFLIRATGDSASLVNQKDFKPKAFA